MHRYFLEISTIALGGHKKNLKSLKLFIWQQAHSLLFPRARQSHILKPSHKGSIRIKRDFRFYTKVATISAKIPHWRAATPKPLKKNGRKERVFWDLGITAWLWRLFAFHRRTASDPAHQPANNIVYIEQAFWLKTQDTSNRHFFHLDSSQIRIRHYLY